MRTKIHIKVKSSFLSTDNSKDFDRIQLHQYYPWIKEKLLCLFF